MKTRLLVGDAVACVALLAVSTVAVEAQRSPEAALRDLADDGRVGNEELFMFQGCPQADPAGRAIFEAVLGAQLDGWGLQYLAKVFAWNVYPTCGYGPLDAWMTSTFQAMHRSGDTGPADAFVLGLGPLINRDLQAAILDAAADASFGGSRMRDEFVRVALTMRPQDQMIPEVIEAFRLPISSQAKANATYRVSRDFGPAFFEAVTRAAPTLPDDVVFTVARAIRSEIQNGRVNPNARGLDQLTAVVQARPGGGPADEIPTGGPASPGGD